MPGALLVLGTLAYVFKPSLQRWANSCTCCCGLCSLGCCVRKAEEAEEAAVTVEKDEQAVEKDEADFRKDPDELPEQLRITIADSSHGQHGKAGHHSRPPSRASQRPSQQRPSTQRQQQHHSSRHDVAATEPSSPSSNNSAEGSDESYDVYPEEPQTRRSEPRHQSRAASAGNSRTPPPHVQDSLHPFRQSRQQSAPARSGSPLPHSHSPPAGQPSPQLQAQLSPSQQLSPASSVPPSPAQSPVEVQLAALRSDWQEEKVKQLTQTVDVMGMMLKLQQDNMALTQQLALLRLQQSSGAPAAFSPQQSSYTSPQGSLLSAMSPLTVQAPLTAPQLPAQPQLTVQTTQPLPRRLPPASPTPVLHLPPPALQAAMTPSPRATDISNAASPASDNQQAAAPVFHDDGEEDGEEEKQAETATSDSQV